MVSRWRWTAPPRSKRMLGDAAHEGFPLRRVLDELVEHGQRDQAPVDAVGIRPAAFLGTALVATGLKISLVSQLGSACARLENTWAPIVREA